MKQFKYYLWAWVPWSLFWQQNQAFLHDHDRLRFGLATSKDCLHVDQILMGELALSSAAQMKGLSHRDKPLQSDEAMAFINGMSKKVSFWMLETHFPLDIAHYDEAGKLREFYHMPVEANPATPIAHYPTQSRVQVSIEMKPTDQKRLWADPYLCVEKVKK